jgi:hypothetical protein
MLTKKRRGGFMKKAKVSKRTLIQRINRRLAKSDKMLKVTRSENATFELGDYFVVDTRRNVIVSHHVKIEYLGREIEVLKPYEELER